MELSDKEDELIDAAILGQLSDEDQVLFDEAMTRMGFRETYEQRRLLSEALEDEWEDELRSSLRQHATRKGSPIRGRSWLAAASIAAIFALGLIMWPSKSSIFEEYYEPFPASPTFRSDDNNSSQYFDAYNREDWTEAEGQIMAYEGQYKAVYLGTVYFNRDEYQAAERYFNEALKSDLAVERYVGEWYLALVALKGGDKETARTRLTKIVDGAGPYAKQGEKVLKELRWTFF